MSVQVIIDITNEFNDNADAKIDVGGYDYSVVQIVSPTTTINFLHTNDSGDVFTSSDGSAVSATNFVTVHGVNLATSTNVSSLAASGLVRFQGIGRYLQLSGTAATATRILVRLYKIH